MSYLPACRSLSDGYIERWQAASLSREKHHTALEVAAARRDAKVAAARVQGAALVAYIGMANVDALTQLEVSLGRRGGPMVDDRARAIVDSYTHVVSITLGRLATEG